MTSLTFTFFIFVGGGTGAVLRHHIFRLLPAEQCGGWPCATWAVNIIGCAFMGASSAYLAEHTAHRPFLQALLQAGFLGAFTTFSAFGADSIKLLQTGEDGLLKAFTYIVISVVGGLSAFILGYRALS